VGPTMSSPGGDDRAPQGVRLRPFRRVSVVIPAKNEERNLGWVMRRLPIEVDEVILVDGNSSDRTIEVALSIRADTVVVNDRVPGKGAALRAGFAAATGDYVVMLDADGSMDPIEIKAFTAALDAGHDLVKGSRFLGNGGTSDISPLRQLGNVALLTMANVLFRTRQTDLCYGYAAFRREAIIPLALDAQGFEIESQLFLRAIANRLSVTEIPSFEAPRISGTSNLHTFRDGWRVFRSIVREWRRPKVDRRKVPRREISIPEAPPIGELVTSAIMGASIDTVE
jgi:glycosyltransferase involved in cell wall biosynthesis